MNHSILLNQDFLGRKFLIILLALSAGLVIGVLVPIVPFFFIIAAPVILLSGSIILSIESWKLIVLGYFFLGFDAFEFDVGFTLNIWRAIVLILLLRFVMAKLAKNRYSKFANLYWHPSLTFYLLMALVSTVIGTSLLVNMSGGEGLRNPIFRGFVQFFSWFLVFFWYAICITELNNWHKIRLTILSLFAGALVLCIYGFIQFVSIQSGFDVPFRWSALGAEELLLYEPTLTSVGGVPRINSFSKEPKGLANFLTPIIVALPFLLTLKNQKLTRRSVFILLVLTWITLFLTFSRTFIILFFLSSWFIWLWGFIMFRENQGVIAYVKWMGSFAGIIGLTILIISSAASFVDLDAVSILLGNALNTFLDEEYRSWLILQFEWELFKSYPVFGVGVGNTTWHFSNHYGSLFGYRIIPTLSWYLGTLAEIGMVGFVSLIWVLGVIYNKIVSGIKHCKQPTVKAVGIAMAAGALALMFNHLHNGGPSHLTFTYLALAQLIFEVSKEKMSVPRKIKTRN